MSLARQIRRLKKKVKEVVSRKQKRKAFLEPLEPRILLSADLKFSMSGEADDITLRLHEADGASTFQVIDNADQSVLLDQALADTSSIEILGSAAADALTVDFSTPFDIPVSFSDATQGDGDALKVLGSDRTWSITGADSGRTGDIEFSGIENLAGGPDNKDTFVFSPEGSLSGTVEGGAGGFDTVVIEGGTYHTTVYTALGPDSGLIQLDGTTLVYAGMEPVSNTGNVADAVYNATAGDDQIDIQDQILPDVGIYIESVNDAFEDSDITEPTGSLKINAGAGNDTIESNLTDFRVPLILDGGDGSDTLDLSGRTAPVTVIRFSDGSAALVDGTHYVAVRNVETFLGAQATLIEEGIPAWVEQGPGTIVDGQVEIPPDDPVSGAVQSVASHPFDSAVIFAASVNGGVWRSLDGGIHWAPLTDQFPTLGMGDIKISPLDADGDPLTGNYGGTGSPTPVEKLVLYAGTGKFSNSHLGGYSLGVLKSTNGGATWSLVGAHEFSGLSITAVVATGLTTAEGEIVLASALSKMSDDGTLEKEGGVFRSTAATDEAAGETWTEANGNVMARLDFSVAGRIRLAVHDSPGYNHI